MMSEAFLSFVLYIWLELKDGVLESWSIGEHYSIPAILQYSV